MRSYYWAKLYDETHVVSFPCNICRHSVIWTLLLAPSLALKHDPHHQAALSPNLAELKKKKKKKKYADSCVEFGLIENSNRMKCTICTMLVAEEVLMPDDLKQYLITKHSEYQYDQQRAREREKETPWKHFLPSEGSLGLNNFWFSWPKSSLSVSKTMLEKLIGA